MADKLCIRNSDGTVWEPSHPEWWTDGDVFAAAISGRSGFYFRRVEYTPSSWWQFWTRGRWARTGEIWEPESGEFTVKPAKEVERG